MVLRPTPVSRPATLTWRREPSDWPHPTNPPALGRDQQGVTAGQMSRWSGCRELSAAHYKTLISTLAHNGCHHRRQRTMASSTPVPWWEFPSECVWRDNGMRPEPNPEAPCSASIQLKGKDTYVEVVVVTGVVLQVDSVKTAICG